MTRFSGVGGMWQHVRRFLALRMTNYGPNRLYHNLGNGKFEEIAEKAGVDKYPGPTMGVGMIDYNEDGRWDLFVANDAHGKL